MDATTTTAVRVRVERPNLPLLWLDTSILIKATRGSLGKKIGDERIERLVRTTERKLEEGKLACLRSEQISEVEGHQHAEDIWRTLEQLTLGVHLHHHKRILDLQIRAGMKSCIQQETEVTLAPDDFFVEDPVESATSARAKGWWLSARTEPHADQLTDARDSKGRLIEHYEALRKRNCANRRTFEEQLRIERESTWQILRQQHLQWVIELKKPEPNPHIVARGSQALTYLRWWTELGGDEALFPEFFTSKHFHHLPYNWILDQLSADLLVSKEPIKQGDIMDAIHMATVVPIATWIVTDKALRHRVQRLRVNSWKARIYSLPNADDLIGLLEDL